MAGTRTKKGILIAAFCWLIVIGIGSVTYKYVVAPILRGKLVSEIGMDTSNVSNHPNSVSENDLKNMVVVDSIKIDPITFGRGKAEITPQSQRTIDEAVSTMEGYPKYFLVVVGNARSDSDAEIANKLVTERVEATVDCFVKAGLAKDRIIALPSRPSGSSGESQIVNFIVVKSPR